MRSALHGRARHRREYREVFVTAFEQAACTLGEGQSLTGSFRANNQNALRAVSERDARARRGQKPHEAGAEAAQAFETRCPACRQRGCKPRNLGCGAIVRRETALRQFIDGLRSKQRGAGGIRPQYLGCIDAPQPHRFRGGGAGRKPGFAEKG